jgi:rhodanese-related sulfurtransferase
VHRPRPGRAAPRLAAGPGSTQRSANGIVTDLTEPATWQSRKTAAATATSSRRTSRCPNPPARNPPSAASWRSGRYPGRGSQLEPVAQDELFRRLREGQVLALDARPEAEYAAGHIPGAVNVPHDQLAARLAELPDGADIIAYCRGRYCVFAPDAVRLLRAAFPPGRSREGCPAGGWPGCRSPPEPAHDRHRRQQPSVLLHTAATHFSKARDDLLAFTAEPRDIWRQIWFSSLQESGRSSPQLAGALPEYGECLGAALSPPPAACGGVRLPFAGRLDRQLVLEHLAVKLRLVRPPGKRPHGQMALPVPVHGGSRRIGQHHRHAALP